MNKGKIHSGHQEKQFWTYAKKVDIHLIMPVNRDADNAFLNNCGRASGGIV